MSLPTVMRYHSTVNSLLTSLLLIPLKICMQANWIKRPEFKYLVFALLFSAIAILSVIPKTEPMEVQATVVSKGTLPSPEVAGDKLSLKTDSGRLVTIGISPQYGVRVGDRVLLNTYETYLFARKYHFIKLIRE